MKKSYKLCGDGAAVITGASAGMGVEFALALAHKGYEVVLVARRKPRLEAMAKHIEEATGKTAHVLALDLASSKAPEKVRAFTDSKGLDVAVLVNNAGFGFDGDILEMERARQDEMIKLNILTLTDLSAQYLPHMVGRGGGGVINVSSVAAFMPMPRNTVYAATKAYVNSYTQALAIEMESKNVRVQAICPGPTETEFSDVAGFNLGNTKYFMMSPREVVRIGLDAFDRGEILTVTGAMNQFLPRARRLLPEELLARVAHFALTQLAPK